MSLIRCPECGKDISDRVSVCPKCNFDMEAYRKKIEEEKLEEEKRKQLEEQKRQEEEEKRKQEEARKEECPECGVLVDKDVENCPNCGFPIKEEKLKLAKEVAEKKAKRKKCFAIIIAISVVLFVIVLFAVQKNKASKYNEAMTLYEDRKFDEAMELFDELGGYKDSEDKLQIVYCHQNMLNIMKEFDIWRSDKFTVEYIINLIEESSKYHVLDDVRHEMIEDLKNQITMVFDYNRSDDFEDAKYVIDYISKYTDTSILDNEYKSALVVQKIMGINDNKNYKEIYDAINEVENKSSNLQKLSDDYIPLYEKYSEFLGDYIAKKHGYNISVRIENDVFADRLDEKINFAIYSFDLELDDASKTREGGRCYKNLKVEKNKLSFDFRDDGIDEPYTNVTIIVNDGRKELLINGKKLDYMTEEPQVESNNKEQKRDPQIGDNEAEVILSSWGSPNSKNKTTTEYGTSEQWVYDNGRYIYFDDGVVTAIQE